MVKAKSKSISKKQKVTSLSSLRKFAPLLLLLIGILIGAYILSTQMLTSDSSARSTSRSPKRCGSACETNGDCLKREEGVPSLICKRARGGGGTCVPEVESTANAACMRDMANSQGSGSTSRTRAAKVACYGPCTKDSQCDSSVFRMRCKEVYNPSTGTKRKMCVPSSARNASRCATATTVGGDDIIQISTYPSITPGDDFIRPIQP